MLDFDPLRVVSGGQRLVIQRNEVLSRARLRRPVRLVVRRVRQRALLHLVEIAPRAPEVDRECQLQVLVAVVVGVVVQIDGDAGRLRLVLEHSRELDHAGRAVRRVQVDGQILVPGRLEQPLGPGDVLVPLRQALVVAGVERRVQVVALEAEAGEHLRDHLGPVHDQPHGLPHPDVVERRHVNRHAQRQPAAGLGHKGVQAAALEYSHLRGRQVGHGVDLTAEQPVDLRGRVVEVDDRDLVKVRLAAAPVVGVAHVDALLPWRERLELVGARADLRGRVGLVSDRHHVEGVARQRLRDRRVGGLKRQLDGVLVQLLHSRDIHRGGRRVASQPVALGPDALE